MKLWHGWALWNFWHILASQSLGQRNPSKEISMCVCVCVSFQNSGAFKTIPWGIHSWTSRWDNEWWFGQRDTNSTQGIAVTQPSHKGCWGCATGTQGRRNPPWPAQWGDLSPLQNPSSYSLHSFALVFSFFFFQLQICTCNFLTVLNTLLIR